MARTPKPMHPIDRAVARLLLAAVNRAGVSRRTLADRTGMSTNRLGIILRGEQPPATVGETEVIAYALDLDAFDVFADAETLARGRGGSLLTRLVVDPSTTPSQSRRSASGLPVIEDHPDVHRQPAKVISEEAVRTEVERLRRQDASDRTPQEH